MNISMNLSYNIICTNIEKHGEVVSIVKTKATRIIYFEN